MCMCVVMCDVIQVANAMEGHWAGPPAMMNIFRNMFGAHLCPLIARRNNFGNFQRYLLQKHIPLAMAQLRNKLQICPPDVFHFILELLKYVCVWLFICIFDICVVIFMVI